MMSWLSDWLNKTKQENTGSWAVLAFLFILIHFYWSAEQCTDNLFLYVLDIEVVWMNIGDLELDSEDLGVKTLAE